MLTETFWLSLAGIIVAFCGGIFAALNKSKCANVTCCWGAMSCIRDTVTEAHIEEHRIDMHVPDTPTNRI
jgi:hypothetical protein